MSERAIPDYIREIVPEYESIPLQCYSVNGELFPDDNTATRFFLDSWKRWRAVPQDRFRPPHVFVLDFKGVIKLNETQTPDALAFMLANYINGLRETYLLFDRLNPQKPPRDDSVATQLERLAIGTRGKERILALREEGQAGFRLIGGEGRGYLYQDLYDLFTGKGWVEGIRVLRENGRPDKDSRLLTLMHQEGLLARLMDRPSNYFRSLVPIPANIPTFQPSTA